MFPGKHMAGNVRTGSLKAAAGGQGGHAGSAHSVADSNGSFKLDAEGM